MTLSIAAGQRITAAYLASVFPQCIVKTADQSVTSSTTFVSDTALSATVVASATYDFTCTLIFEGGTGGSSDLKWQWSVPSGATVAYNCVHVNQSGTTIINTEYAAATSVNAETATAGTKLALTMEGTLIMSTTAGSFTLQWAQNTSSGTATIVHAGSKLRLLRSS